MTSGRVSGGPSRGSGASTWTPWTRDGIGAIALVLALGLAFRFIIAQANPGSGFKVDLQSFQAWAGNLASQGLGGFYERPFFHDYTPGYLYVLYLVGLVGRATGNIGDLIKIPPILADIGLGWLVWSMVRELGGGRKAALIGAGLVVANPVTWFDSVIWGQVDSFGVLFLLLGVREVWRDRPERAAIFTVIAALIKPQLAILAPVLAAVTIRRALWPTEDQLARRRPDDPAAGWLSRLLALETRTDRPIRILTTAAAGFLTAVVLCWPFGLSVLEPGRTGEVFHSGLIDQVFKTAGGYPYVSVNAYNPWALASVGGPGPGATGIAANGAWACDTLILNPAPGGISCSEAVFVGPFPAVYVGAALLIAAFAIVCLVVAWRPSPVVILTGGTILAIAFFILPTRVHERYLYPFIALGAILAAVSWRWLAAYLVLSLTTFLNMYVVLTTIYPNNPGIRDWLGVGATLRSEEWVTRIALAGLAAALWAFSQMRGGATRHLEGEFEDSAAGDPIDDDDADAADLERGPGRTATGWALAGASAMAGGGATATGAATRSGRSWAAATPGSAGARTAGAAFAPAPPPPPLPAWYEPPSFAELGPIGWFRAKLDRRPVRADRSRDLQDEPSGRLDRLDVWVLVVLVVAILGIRMFRLSEPYQMHFDEVYHARTATEFLQKWRYGIDHDIYEWTHPHLAKYAMAGGLIAWGDDRVTATSSLGVPVLDAVVEKRTEDEETHKRLGDRVDVVTGSEVRFYDLTTRALVAAMPLPGASAVALDTSGSRLIVGSTDGSIWSVDLAALDAARSAGSAAPLPEPEAFGQVDGAITKAFVPSDGSAIAVATESDQLILLDPSTAEVLATIPLETIGGIGPGGTAPTLVGTAGAIGDPATAAQTIASITGEPADEIQTRLTGTGDRLIVAGVRGSDDRTKLQEAIDQGRLDGFTIETLPRIAVADANGLELISPEGRFVAETVDLGAPAHGLAYVDADGQELYLATDPDPALHQLGRLAIVAVGGDPAKNGPTLTTTVQMPGAVSRVAYDDQTEMVHVLGRTPAGDAATVYVLEPHSDPPSVYADAKLPFEPTAWALDVNRMDPTNDRQQLLAFAGTGDVATVDVGQHEFAWRLPGVLAGAAMAGFLYLLARILFRRRLIALMVGVFCLADGMLFVQSRIGMNDAYVGLGIVAAYTLFAALWMGVWRHRAAFWVAMPIIGAFLGLALASKWVALYAIVGMGFLILIRSAIGRLLAILALIVMTTFLGYLAINVPAGTGFGNLPFVAIMVALTVIAVIANVLHPVRWSRDEIRFAIGTPLVLAALVALGALAVGKAGTVIKVGSFSITPLLIALGIAGFAAVVAIAFVVAGRLGFGPLAAAPEPGEPAALLAPASPPPAAAWLRPGAQLGLPVVWMVVCLLVLPVAIYVVSYIPWAMIDSHTIVAGWPPGHTGQTLLDLTGQMYAYHNGLPNPHAASSPWWAWLFDLKPVWFYQEGLAGNTTAAIYDAGNLVIWWLGVPAMIFVSYQAFTRRSLPLALIAIGYAFQWVSWARIDRAAFQYHYYTSLPFLILALAYFLAELWHGASRRTWLFARLAAGAAILGPAVAWVLARPLCGFVGVQRANQGSIACAPTIPEFLLTTQTAAVAIVVGISVLIVARLFNRLGDDGRDDRRVEIAGLRLTDSTVTLGLLGITAFAAIAAAAWIRGNVNDDALIQVQGVPVEPVALILGLPALAIAAFVATARDARRFVAGVLVAAVAWFVIVYPNFSALPLPTEIANVYQGALPTYLYAFQFPVNNVAATVPIQLTSPTPWILGASVVFLVAVVGYSAWVWRLAVAERLAEEDEPPSLGSGQAAAGAGGGGSAGD